jgi:pyruvate, water dikinase
MSTNERNEAVKKYYMHRAIEKLQRITKRRLEFVVRHQADFPDFAQFLVRKGIDSISLNPDTVIKTRFKIAEQEKKLKKN